MKKEELAIALSGGSASGMAHIGVIKALEENGISPDVVIGTSAGALVGGVYVAKCLLDFEKILIHETKKGVRKILKFWPTREGIFKTKKLEEELRILIGDKKIENLDKKFMAVAVNLLDGKKTLIDKGDLCEAIMSSISVPLLFPPKHKRGMLLVDGGLEDPLPIDEGFSLAKKVIAVNILSPFKNLPIKERYNFIDIAEAVVDIFQKEIIKSSLKRHEQDQMILIKPRVNIGAFSFDKSKEAVAVGYDETMTHIEEIKNFVSKK